MLASVLSQSELFQFDDLAPTPTMTQPVSNRSRVQVERIEFASLSPSNSLPRLASLGSMKVSTCFRPMTSFAPCRGILSDLLTIRPSHAELEYAKYALEYENSESCMLNKTLTRY